MSQVSITIPPGKWVNLPEIDVDIRHDEIVSKAIYYDTDDDSFILRETPWMIRKADGSETPASTT